MSAPQPPADLSSTNAEAAERFATESAEIRAAWARGELDQWLQTKLERERQRIIKQ